MEEKENDIFAQEKAKKETAGAPGEAIGKAENTGAKSDEKALKEALADYVLARMPGEMAESLKRGKSVGEVMAQMENTRLKKENEDLKLRLEQVRHKPITLAGEGGEREKDPFALGFMQAFNNY